MAKIHESIEIKASIDTIHALLTTPKKIVLWYDGVDAVQPSSDYPAVNSSIEGAMKILAVELKAKQTVLENKPGLLSYQLEGMANGTQAWRTTDLGGGKVRLEVDTDFNLVGGVFGKLAEPMAIQMLGASARKSLENIKKMAEGH
ncbi:MAG: SRPBCC family protein [Chloroflexi bacterium]|nr:SRPBCC family protein [Chloroflexota bacterium]